ncbi:AfsR/SARP family transcriptional regulator [Micromonospora sp. WMMD812]|uniref:AfsR/SARP family transcriptional regulator n=1 Tax=Micromonospora sp. WMMD812 TaxID=3015152 RepID=UPI00248D2F3B|nr:AfsR/SARP family transcriptional regulator [Micromonospora sp. WMMD812]WBB68401.1 AfsR/SARP family transcriptional regulator [Micromonospora sp. WMMD812]
MTESASAVRFTILGSLGARRGDVDLELGGRQQRLVLALLLTHGGSVVGLHDLVDTIWNQDPPTSAVNIVHRYIGALRRLIEPDLPVRAVGNHLIRHAVGYQLRVDEGSLDLLRFRRLVAHARRATEPGPAVRLYTEALALWRGSCAAGLDPESRAHPAFTGIDAECAQAVRDGADTALRSGQVRLMLPALRQAAGQNPLDEALQARLVLALAADGRQAEALSTFQEVRRRLGDELGIDPSPELLDAYDRLLHQRTSAQWWGRAPSPVGTVAVGPLAHSPVDAEEAIGLVKPPPTPAQLPPDHPFFVGRADLLARAEALIEADRRHGRATVALAIDGMPGVGKTTLAIRLGHRLAAAYPDGQLYADLRGFAAQGCPMSPAEALRGLLSSLGVPRADAPTELHALAGLYRTILAGRRFLIVLDNCRDFGQVRHLLPGAPGCLAIVTSRNRLTGLITNAGAHPLPVDLPPPDETREYLARRLGAGRTAAEPAAVDDIIADSGRLPLALALVAARAATQPDTPLAEIALELAGRLDSLGGNAETSLTAAFSWSYRELSPPAARLFRLLSLHPDPDLTVESAASLADVDPATGATLLGELDTHMLTQVRSGRHRVHRLLRAYAAGLSEEEDTAHERRAAVMRLFDHFRSSAYHAHLRLDPPVPVPEPPAPGPGVTPLRFDGRDEAIAFFEAERPVLAAVVAQAGAQGAHEVAWHVTRSMTSARGSRRPDDRLDDDHAQRIRCGDPRRSRGAGPGRRSPTDALSIPGDRDRQSPPARPFDG